MNFKKQTNMNFKKQTNTGENKTVYEECKALSPMEIPVPCFELIVENNSKEKSWNDFMYVCLFSIHVCLFFLFMFFCFFLGIFYRC